MEEQFICDVTYEENTGVKNPDGSYQKRSVKCPSKAKDAHEDIDIDGIIDVCGQIADAASQITAIDTNIQNFAAEIGPDKLSVNGTDISNLASTCSSASTGKISEIQSQVEGVKSRAIDFFNAKQRAYNIKAKNECKHR